MLKERNGSWPAWRSANRSPRLGRHRLRLSQWMRIRTQSGMVLKLNQHSQATNYTEERVQLVMERIEGGEFLRHIAVDLGMDPCNLARYCRRKGVSLFSAEDLKKTTFVAWASAALGNTLSRMFPKQCRRTAPREGADRQAEKRADKAADSTRGVCTRKRHSSHGIANPQ